MWTSVNPKATAARDAVTTTLTSKIYWFITILFCLSKFRQDEAKIGQSPALCNTWTPTWSIWMPHWSFGSIQDPLVFLGSSTSPCISQDVEVPVRHRHQSIDLGDRHPKGAAVKSKGRAKESECVQMAILVGKIMENRKMMIEAADGMG